MLSSPLHPLLVHFPIALLLLGTVVQFLAIWKPNFFSNMAFFILSVGFLSGIVTYLTGDGAEDFARTHWGNAYRSVIETHQAYATATLVLFGAAVGLRIFMHYFKKSYLLPLVLVLCLAGSAALALTGYYGGKMVYEQSHTVHTVLATHSKAK
ncbi:DUF2231 domain-containing protein [Terrilactibacillus sp. S3-3]|nr:DUF2231 domain-containing protein [Terrilactibacillus sp. S3-3]